MLRIVALATAFGAALASPANAIQELTPEPAWTYRVVGVSSGDRLNIRDQPGAGSGIAGALQPGAEVTVTGVRQETGGSVWWKIVVAGGTGWVNARYLAPVNTEATKGAAFPLDCSGTEPFWSLSVDGVQARFATPDGERRWRADPPRSPAGSGHVAIRLADAEAVGHLAAFRTYTFCSDGMSDQQYPFEALLIAPDGRVLSGCCARGG